MKECLEFFEIYLKSLDNKIQIIIEYDNYKLRLIKREDLKKRKISKFFYIENIINAYNQLDNNERKFFYYTYIDSNKRTNNDIAILCGYTESHYYRLKTKLNCKLAFLLDLEVYEVENDIVNIYGGEKSNETN